MRRAAAANFKVKFEKGGLPGPPPVCECVSSVYFQGTGVQSLARDRTCDDEEDEEGIGHGQHARADGLHYAVERLEVREEPCQARSW